MTQCHCGFQPCQGRTEAVARAVSESGECSVREGGVALSSRSVVSNEASTAVNHPGKETAPIDRADHE
jgi:Na+-translocating ferredoxin:NAD+ oxidoreductase RNF subunit RnfB